MAPARALRPEDPAGPSHASSAARAQRLGLVQPPKATPADAFHAATSRFLRGQRIDMTALAAELSVSRATLYRWTGDRDRLLVDVLWGLGESILDQALHDNPGHGRERVLAVVETFMAQISSAEALRHFLENDGALALRILTSRDGVHRHTVAAVERLLEEESRHGFQPSIEPSTLAYAIVRLGEAFIYNDAINNVDPDLAAAAAVLSRLLG